MNSQIISSLTKSYLVMLAIATTTILAGCREWFDFPGHGEGHSGNQAKKFSADVPLAWIKLQQDLTKSTPGFDPPASARSFSYSGLTLYESIVKGMPGYKSVVSSRIGVDINSLGHKQSLIHWPAAANAAMAFIIKNLFANTSVVNVGKIDSLESYFNWQFQQQHLPSNILEASAAYGRDVAARIFEWSKTDGGHEAYLSAVDPNYVVPVGPGKWVPTSPSFPKPVRPHWGDNRSFIPSIAVNTLPPAPPAYSESEGSEFRNGVQDVYDRSLTLTADDSTVVKTWGDIAGNYGTASHYTNIATQLIEENDLKLDQAAVVYAKHGVALYEATICVFKAKYTYNLIRPISYIKSVMGHSNWTTVIGTPSHPEYPSAHATLGGASYTVLEGVFGKNHAFTDRTHENLFGARSYNRLKDYAVEAANSRFIAGIHYSFSAEVGLSHGAKIGTLVNNLPFKGGYK